jgi:ubiquinone/menaquinone biosynthesis C-methylase UbiE
MNENHAKVCTSPEWAEYLQGEVLPAVTRGVDLGAELLEVGPGPGAATRWLHSRVTRLVAVEHESAAAAALTEQFAGSNVEVVEGDATALTFADASFDSAACFTMLHHVPTAALQNRLLAEVLRVLRPGGVLVGSDSLPSDGLHHFHGGDTYNPIEPGTLLTRLQTLGFAKITVSVDYALTFVAHKAGPPDRRWASQE